MSAFREVLAKSKNIIAVAGAGLSTSSGMAKNSELSRITRFNHRNDHCIGIPTFRGSGGMWRRFNALSLATPQAFAQNPARVWQFYHYRRET